MKSALIALALATAATCALAQDYSADEVARRNIERRGVEAVIWGMPAVNFDLMLQAAISANAKSNQIVFCRACRTGKIRRSRPIPT